MSFFHTAGHFSAWVLNTWWTMASLRMVISLRPYLGYVGSPQIRMGALSINSGKNMENEESSFGYEWTIHDIYLLYHCVCETIRTCQGHLSDQQKSKSIYTY